MPRLARTLARGLFASALALAAGNSLAQPAPSAAPAAGSALHIRVRGSSELQAVASADADTFTLRGELIDDAGVAIPAAPIAVQAFGDGDRPIKLGALQPCPGSAPGSGSPPRAGPDEVVFETDEHGGFCVTGRSPAPKLRLGLRFRGTKLNDASEATVTVEAEHEHLLHTVLRIEPQENIDLDRPTVTVTASLRVDRTEAARLVNAAAGSAHREGLVLTLEDERGAKVAEAATAGDGRARFEVKTALLDGPGSGELRVRFAGNGLLSKGAASQHVVRRAEARLALARPIEPVDPEDGAVIEIDVATARGPAAGGVVEIRRAPQPGAEGARPAASDSVGAATVDEKGHARVVAQVPGAAGSTVPLVARYVPAAPWFRAGPELSLAAPLKGSGILRQVLLAAVVLGAAAWIVNGWRRAPRPRVLPGLEGDTVKPTGKAGVRVVAASGATGWSGVVGDAHEGTPLAGVRLTIVAPSFSGDGVVATATTDERGAFQLAGAAPAGARLLVESELHSTHEQALPPPSVLAVALVTRRRSLLDRLVRWAKAQGAPFDGSPEPTPGHVRRVAARSSAEGVERWAGEVERAAFGPAPIDAAAEREVRAGEPRATK